LATRYHLLPSEILRRGDTLDVLILDTALQWHNAKEQEARAKIDGRPAVPKIAADKLKDMLDNVRKNGHDN